MREVDRESLVVIHSCVSSGGPDPCRRLGAYRFNQRTSALFLRMTAEPADAETRHMLSVRSFERAAMPHVARVDETAALGIEPRLLLVALEAVIAGSVYQWTTQPAIAAEQARAKAREAATALCTGWAGSREGIQVLPLQDRPRPTLEKGVRMRLPSIAEAGRRIGVLP